MENYETMIVEIKGIEQKESKNGRVYHSIDTDMGKMSVFEGDIVNDLKKCYGNGCKCEISVAQSNGFKNVRKFIGEAAKTQVVKPNEAFKEEKFSEARHLKDQSIYTSYVKDLIVSGMKPDEAIELIKKVKEEFK